jgi:hypothetical protein
VTGAHIKHSVGGFLVSKLHPVHPSHQKQLITYLAGHPNRYIQEEQEPIVTTMASSNSVSLEVVDVENPKGLNCILGHAHFIKTVEDLYEELVQSSTALKFGIAFNEASEGHGGDDPGRRVRFDGNDNDLIELAKSNALRIGAGHSFIIFIDGGFPVNCLNAVKSVTEVCTIHCATSNPLQVVLAKTSEERKGIIGVIDGVCPMDFEDDKAKAARHSFLRMIGYKR